MDLVFLPATAPADEHYGSIPVKIDGSPEVRVHAVHYPELVWYNASVCAVAIEQIRALAVSPIVLVGFSKSGLGAWNIARELADVVEATIIFDSPVARQVLPPWGTAPFYANDAEWQKDLPINHIDTFQAAMPASHRLVLSSGPGFHDDMQQLSDELVAAGLQHTFMACPHLAHHWNSGWIERGVGPLLGCIQAIEPLLSRLFECHCSPELPS